MTARAPEVAHQHHYCRCGGALHLCSDPETVAEITAIWWAFSHAGEGHGQATQARAAAARRRAAKEASR